MKKLAARTWRSLLPEEILIQDKPPLIGSYFQWTLKYRTLIVIYRYINQLEGEAIEDKALTIRTTIIRPTEIKQHALFHMGSVLTTVQFTNNYKKSHWPLTIM